MPPSDSRTASLYNTHLLSLSAAIILLFCLLFCAQVLLAQSAYIRVNQAGYEGSTPPFRAYLMSKSPLAAANFLVINSKGVTAASGPIGALLGTWGHSKTVTFSVYAIDFHVPGG